MDTGFAETARLGCRVHPADPVQSLHCFQLEVQPRRFFENFQVRLKDMQSI